MAGVAALLKDRGLEVTGCDNSENRISGWLADKGIRVQQGHSADHIDGSVDWVVRSTAVSPDTPEIQAAISSGVPVFRRGEVLPRLLDDATSVAVSGTHGKTTTSAIIAQVLKHAGMSPSWCVGGEIDALGGVAGRGDATILVAEADESDGTVALYCPDIAVITNIEFDHMEHFSGPEGLEECFRIFANQAKKVVFCLDDPKAVELFGGLEMAISYGMDCNADVSASSVELRPGRSRFCLTVEGNERGEVCLPVPGIHNILNALAAAAVAIELGVAPKAVCEALSSVELPRRRFERVVDRDGILVISDYAHHPSEIAALIRSARPMAAGRLLGVFQPHRYTRTKALMADFPACFEGLDELVITPVYPASEAPIDGGLACDLYETLRQYREDPEICFPRVLLGKSPAHAWDYLRRSLHKDDVLLVIGAGDVEEVANRAREEFGSGPNGTHLSPHTGEPTPPFGHPSKEGNLLQLSDLRKIPSLEGCPKGGVGSIADMPKSASFGGVQDRTESLNVPCEVRETHVLKGLLPDSEVSIDEPLHNKNALRVGGTADIWVKVGSEKDLAALLAWTNENGVPFTVLGGGFNVVVSDLGVRGVVARLVGAEFRDIYESDNLVLAGASATLSDLAGWAADHSLAGLEFLDGIPGTVGGAVRMNAGAWGKEIGNYVSWIRCLKKDGSVHIVDRKELGAVYRDCLSLRESVMIEAAFAVPEGEAAVIRQTMDESMGRRSWMPNSCCAGSIFKNPEGDSAGRLLEQAGMKSTRIGGAEVSAAHANILVAGKDATASDVEALIQKMQAAVAFRFGVELEPEIKILS
jgi:UDP-N-acetylmuramate--alanine ligase